MRDCEAKGNMTNRGHYTKRQKSYAYGWDASH
jgi:hypothetical protein